MKNTNFSRYKIPNWINLISIIVVMILLFQMYACFFNPSLAYGKFENIDSKYTNTSSNISAPIIYYGGLGGSGKRVDITFESPTYKFKINIRNKQGGLYPSHIMCDYIKK